MSDCFSPADLECIVADTFVRQIDFHEQIGSTNDRGMRLAAGDDHEFPLLVLTDSQTAGRGRGSNSWWSGRGALTFSLVLATEAARLPSERWPQVSLTVGFAVAEVLEELLSRGVPATSRDSLPVVQLKWPNDVYIEGKKVCGILVEVPRSCPDRLLLGIGINVNNTLENAPAELQAIASSLSDLTGNRYSLAEVLIAVLQHLAGRLEPSSFWNAEVLAGWRGRCFLSGKLIEIDNGTRQVVGLCQGIEETGALKLEVDGQLESHLAGVITVL